jgi:hypothetical protein
MVQKTTTAPKHALQLYLRLANRRTYNCNLIPLLDPSTLHTFKGLQPLSYGLHYLQVVRHKILAAHAIWKTLPDTHLQK